MAARESNVAERKTRQHTARSVAIAMIALGSACCGSIEFVATRWPDLAAIPGAAGSMSALLGLLLLFREQQRGRRAAEARATDCIRISPYRPEMADGSDGMEMLKLVLMPASSQVPLQPRHRRTTAARPAPKARAASLTPFFAAHDVRLEHSAPQGASATLFSALRLGQEWARDLELSGRARAQLERDPFVQRLARLG